MDKCTALFDIELRDDGWTVIDVRTGVAAAAYGKSLIGLSLEDADDLADLLTHREWRTQVTH